MQAASVIILKLHISTKLWKQWTADFENYAFKPTEVCYKQQINNTYLFTNLQWTASMVEGTYNTIYGFLSLLWGISQFGLKTVSIKNNYLEINCRQK